MQPAVAVLASVHVVAQSPQFVGSIAVSAQLVAPLVVHVARGGAQVVPHAPPEHTWPAGHAVPHAPQLALSVWRFVHTPEQTVRPALHDATHSPAVHALPGGHARSQRPQCASSVSRSRHAAPHAD